ncbi:hypothetical protein JAAARDRAFT_165561 [Jaapia argillacea MUCL 33604]|uniref:Alginate lyase domain-containing protein n=1 Tax=Jaapia argillacea MUCL 33604 TaxID=933084 RepID=A0A067PER2_9AGAM|nr:hypothetical protein JAAARDRAFT_165561 [Jaapia argillacea MUCL 33604]
MLTLVLLGFFAAIFSAYSSVLAQGSVPAVTSYANDFVDPAYILEKSFPSSTHLANETIIQWAGELAAAGPWSVTSKPIAPPSGNKHDYLSWAPYLWPNCTAVGNHTALTPEQIWTTCPYITRDGLFNPDTVNLIPDNEAFQNMSDAVWFNSMAWVLTGDNQYSANAAKFINTWFLDPATAMNPNLNYAQVHRGPGVQNGSHTGLLDLKCMVKVVNAVLILRDGKSSDWTTQLDTAFVTWGNKYIPWLETNVLAIAEEDADNNHGTFFYNQLAAVQILVGNLTGAKLTLETYFTKQYLKQINSNGEQPLEAIRTRPYHYRAYNLAAMITNARLAHYLNYPVWNLTTSSGATIQTAANFAMTVVPFQNESSWSTLEELNPCVAAVAAVYGDPHGTYAAFLKKIEPAYPVEPYFLWNQPLSDLGYVSHVGGGSSNSSSDARAKSTGTSMQGRLGRGVGGVVGVFVSVSLLL